MSVLKYHRFRLGVVVSLVHLMVVGVWVGPYLAIAEKKMFQHQRPLFVFNKIKIQLTFKLRVDKSGKLGTIGD